MTKLLILDTASSQCWVALHSAGELLVERSAESRRAAQQLLPMIDRLLATAGLVATDLSAIAVINGPGSFTGMRIGVGIAQGLAYACDLPVVTISSLLAMAASADQQESHGYWLVAEAARDEETYLGAYMRTAGGRFQAVVADQVLHRDDDKALPDLLASSASWAITGSHAEWLASAARELPVRLHPVSSRQLSPPAICKLALQSLASGHSVRPDQALPNYVKDQLDYS